MASKFINDVFKGITGTFAVLNEIAKDAAHTTMQAIDTLIPGDWTQRLQDKTDEIFFPTYQTGLDADLEKPVTQGPVNNPGVTDINAGVHKNLQDIEELQDPSSVPKIPSDTEVPSKNPNHREPLVTISFGDIVRNSNENNYYTDNSVHNNVVQNFITRIDSSLASQVYPIMRTPTYGNFFADISPVYSAQLADRIRRGDASSSAYLSTASNDTYMYDYFKGGKVYEQTKKKPENRGNSAKRAKKRK